MNAHPVNAADGLPVAMILILALAFATVLTVLLTVIRHARRQERTEVEALLEELRTAHEEKKGTPILPTAPPRQPWEREADWWKGNAE